MGGYRFLMENYQPGDKICLFGFSRGAYTARCLAGMIHKVGLLPKSNDEHVAFAYQKYLNDTAEGKKAAQAFKRAFSVSVPIEFVGVWDTVASVGWTFKHLPFTDSNTIIKTFRHALALDERRVQFMPNPWHNSSDDPNAAKNDPESGEENGAIFPGRVKSWLSLPRRILSAIKQRGPVDPGGDDNAEEDTDIDEYSDDLEYHCGRKTDVKEVWFAGCHADVGGGSTINDEVNTLANPSLQWMVSQVLDHAPSMVFRPDAFTYDEAFSTLTVTDTDKTPRPPRLRLPHVHRHATPGSPSTSSSANPSPLSSATATTAPGATTAAVNAVPGAFVEEQRLHSITQVNPVKDANAEKNDQLVKKRVWLILEYLPTFQYYQNENGVWQTRLRWNKERPREIYDTTPKIHESVKLRKDYQWPTKFIPKRGRVVEPEYVK
ncbi:hypothetical protein FRC01_001646 [Tulasnella sp. 417]|nr:hypothetical protein FRC01_001646 [Tulasnella sp. 417]